MSSHSTLVFLIGPCWCVIFKDLQNYNFAVFSRVSLVGHHCIGTAFVSGVIYHERHSVMQALSPQAAMLLQEKRKKMGSRRGSP